MAAGLPKAKMKRWIVISLLLTILFSIPVFAGSSASATVTVSWKVLPFQSLTILGGEGNGTSVTSHFELGTPTPAEIAAGFIEEDGALTLVAASNIPWTVKVHAVEANMGESYDGTYVKPLSDFLIRANGGEFTPISQLDQTLASGTRGSYQLTIDYKVLLDPEFKPGDYGITLVYTITGE